MKRVPKHWLGWSVLFLGFISGLPGPWVATAGAQTKPGLAIVPFFVERREDLPRGAVCPVCKQTYRTGEIRPGAEKALTRLLAQKMESQGAFRVIPPEKVEEVLSRVSQKELEERPTAASIAAAKEHGAEFVLIGFLFRFEERVGSSLGVEKPASVGFDLHMIRLKDGKGVWAERFDETQRPLSENVLKIGSFFRRKASWVKAEELAAVGMDEALKRLPGPKELEELK